jgi:hypothetical protein
MDWVTLKAEGAKFYLTGHRISHEITREFQEKMNRLLKKKAL